MLATLYIIVTGTLGIAVLGSIAYLLTLTLAAACPPRRGGTDAR